MVAKLIFGIALVVLLAVACVPKEVEDPKITSFVTCLKDAGVEMYGSITCSVCERQRKLFGASFEHVEEIECHPHTEGNQAERCLDRNIEITPTWILEQDDKEVKRLKGYQTFGDLASFSGCPAPS